MTEPEFSPEAQRLVDRWLALGERVKARTRPPLDLEPAVKPLLPPKNRKRKKAA